VPHPHPPASDLTARGRATRAAILAAASHLLAEEGEVEVARVAARAQVSVGLPYRYFESRSGLIAAVVEDFHLRLAEAVVYAEFPGSTWHQREEARVHAWVRYLYADPLSPVVLGGLGGDPAVASIARQRLTLAIEVGTRNIAHAQRAGDLPTGNDPMLLAATVLGGVQTAVATALATSPRPSAVLVERSLWTFVRGAAEATPAN
jgi:AcrR family transcriptional regulator